MVYRLLFNPESKVYKIRMRVCWGWWKTMFKNETITSEEQAHRLIDEWIRQVESSKKAKWRLVSTIYTLGDR